MMMKKAKKIPSPTPKLVSRKKINERRAILKILISQFANLR